MALDLARQGGVKRLAATLGFALVASAGGGCGCIGAGIAAPGGRIFFLRRCGLRRCSQTLGFVEEHVFLFRAAHFTARFTAGGEHLVHHSRKALFEQVALDAQYPVLAGQGITFGLQCISLRVQRFAMCAQCIAFGLQRFERLAQGVQLFVVWLRSHRPD